MRIWMMTSGSLEDLLPFLTIGRALRSRGHEISFDTGNQHEGYVAEAGFDCSPLPERGSLRQQGTVVLVQRAAFGARLTEEALGAPYCMVYRSPGELGAPPVDPVSPEIHSPGPQIQSPRQELALFPEWFCGRAPHWPAQLTLTGFVTVDEPFMPVAARRVEAFLDTGAPPIVFCPGTGTPLAPGFFKESLAACEALGTRTVLLTPDSGLVPPSLPHWALHVGSIPLHSLLRRCSAIVYPGGMATCAQAMRAGVPQLVTPITAEQLDTAQHIRALGLGVSIPLEDYGDGIATDKLIQLLSGNGFRHACQHVAAQFAHDKPLETICDLVARLQ